MSWIEITWAMMIAASLTLGGIHLFVWVKQRSDYAHLLFFVLASSAAAYGAFEMAMMQAQSPQRYADVVRWAHLPLATFVVSTVGFVHFFFHAGRRWLAYAVCALRVLTLVLDFTTGVNVNFTQMTAVDHVTIFGATISGPVGIASPWGIVPQLSNLLLLAYVVDAAVVLWRRGDGASRRRAVIVGGGIAGSMAVVAAFAALIVTGIVHAPTILTPGVFAIVLAVGYELGWDVINASQLAGRLRASEAHFRQVVEAVPNAIVLVDRRGRIALANAQAEVTFGRSRSDLVGASIDSLLPVRYRAGHEGHRAAYLSDPRPRAMGAGRELYALRSDGVEFPVEVALNPIQTEDGQSVLVSVVDITERRRVERAAARQRDELAHLSRVAMLGELSGSLAHELNQPLTAILSNAQAALRLLGRTPPQTDKVEEILTDIVKSDRRAGMVIQRLRSFIRKEESQRVALDINELVREALVLMHSDLLNRQIRLRSDLAAGPLAVLGDRIQLQQVLVNFVVNGCDAMEGCKTDRELWVRTRSDSDGVVVSVADRGVGIPAGDLERIFEPFMTTKSHGMGLGLAICKSIVEAHGGAVWASSNAERGAILQFRLPMNRSAAA